MTAANFGIAGALAFAVRASVTKVFSVPDFGVFFEAMAAESVGNCVWSAIGGGASTLTVGPWGPDAGAARLTSDAGTPETPTASGNGTWTVTSPLK